MAMRMDTSVRVVSLLVTSVMGPLVANAAVPKSSPEANASSVQVHQGPEKKYPAKIMIENTRAALGMPLRNRLEVLQAQGPEGYRNLVKLMFDPEMSMEVRWRAVTAAGRLGQEFSVPELEKALRSSEWFMRNAGLIALSKIDREKTIQWSRQLLSDDALIVRSAAVDLLERARDAESASLLWQKLYSKENFKGKQSLFIRRRIVETLARIEKSGQEAKFIELLADKDESLHGPAISALERLTQQKLGERSASLKDRRAQWQQWWSERSRL